MKVKLFLSIAATFLTVANTVLAQAEITKNAPPYDAELAKKLGGNDGGMKNYLFVILKTGPNDATIKGKERTDIFAGHMANIRRLSDAGTLAVAGPFGKNDKGYRGLYIFNVATVEEALKIAESDPAVKAGVFIVEATPWFGSASLMATPEIHKRITKPAP
ncbi:MAG: YciI family protein [Pyrinomonadaceae bacterium]